METGFFKIMKLKYGQDTYESLTRSSTTTAIGQASEDDRTQVERLSTKKSEHPNVFFRI